MWTRFNYFIGAWRGAGRGKAGPSRVERRYEFVLNSKFLFVRSTLIYDPQETHRNDPIHEDWGFISYHRARETYMFRQFHSEGFVNDYVLNELTEEEQAVSFVTEAIENLPPGWRARQTCRILGPEEFLENFEMAGPDKEFRLYTETHFQRVRSE